MQERGLAPLRSFRKIPCWKTRGKLVVLSKRLLCASARSLYSAISSELLQVDELCWPDEMRCSRVMLSDLSSVPALSPVCLLKF